MVLERFLAHAIAVLRAADTPPRIAAGFVLGMMAGLIPSLPLNLLVALLLIVLHVNLVAAFLAMALFGSLSYLATPLFDTLGAIMLAFQPIRTTLGIIPVAPYAGASDTLVTGSIVASLLLAAPLFTLTRHAVLLYRHTLDPRVNRWRPIRLIKASPLYRRYLRLRRMSEHLLGSS